jgi:uncharacterized phiE125 gp8 family phage protein
MPNLMRWKVTSPPLEEPLDKDQVKLALRIDQDDEDDFIDELITSARKYVEEECRRALITQTLLLSLPYFPWGTYVPWIRERGGVLRLPRPPLQSIVSVKFTDTSGVLQTLSPALYQVSAFSDHEPAELAPVYGTYWPVVQPVLDAVQIQYKAGFGDTADKVPVEARRAMMLYIGNHFAHRETSEPGRVSTDVGIRIDDLLAPLRHGVDEY